ncbi:MAG: thymidine phosphorylase [Planctomycetota bacterium]|nr:thymidine phosphorylase [Planctomycetota bacterium]MDA0935024.1 thymidine phosphorylase [Planctomycetota bacterium]
MHFHPARLNAHKRDGGKLSADQIRDVVHGAVDGSLSDAQLGAFLMAVCCRGMDAEETATLTLAMRDSGEVLGFPSVPGRKIDKHSTGGVGDKVSLALAPLVAACGVPVPMISGRGLGHTGGTLDKLRAIPGYRTDLAPAEFEPILAACGFVMAGAGPSIAPADWRLYAVRDVTGTVESIPLITASILSKKLAEGIDGLVMDVKVGRAAILKDRDTAHALAQSLVSVGELAGIDVTALLTCMDAPLGRTIGNRLELLEAVALLRGDGPSDLRAVTWELAAEMLELAGVVTDRGQAWQKLDAAVDSGEALRRLRQNVELQGGDPSFVDDPKALGEAGATLGVSSPASGYVADIDPLELGLCAMDLGAGRRQPADEIDLDVGIVLARQLGEEVRAGEPLAIVQARTLAEADAALPRVLSAFRIGDTPPRPRRMVLERLTSA